MSVVSAQVGGSTSLAGKGTADLGWRRRLSVTQALLA